MDQDFNEYINNFKEKSLKEKQSIVYDQLKMLAEFSNKLCKELEIPNEILLNKELLDLTKEDYTEDDFAEALIVLINSIQNSISDYTLGISDLLDKLDGQ